ncbi:MAG: hypothetical protein H0V53_01280, partial [Rubrobacter sp.]|nr:hypothetical protein [Rubrobacter sp.]
AIATALMPELSERHSLGDEEGYRETLSFGLRTMAFMMVPASVGLVALATPIIGVLLERGQFGPEDTASVASLLVAYSVGLLGYAAYFFLVRAFYSRQNTKTPALLNVGLFGLYTALAYGLSQLLGLGVVGVALALSGANAVLALVCLAATRWELRSIGGRRLLISLTRILLAGAVMYAVARGGLYLFGDGSGFTERLVVLAAVGGASLAAYLGAAYLLRAEEIKSAALLLHRRGTPAPEDQTPAP